MLMDHARTKIWDLGVAEADVVVRIYRGLLADDASVTPPEAKWVITRLAELLDWECRPTAVLGPPAQCRLDEAGGAWANSFAARPFSSRSSLGVTE